MNIVSWHPGILLHPCGIYLLFYKQGLQLGGKVQPGGKREYGPAEIDIAKDTTLFREMTYARST